MTRPAQRLRKPGSPARSGARPIQYLREWLARVDQIGELVRVKQAVDRD